VDEIRDWLAFYGRTNEDSRLHISHVVPSLQQLSLELRVPGVRYNVFGNNVFGNNVLRRFAELARRVQAELDVKDAILNGEVVALDDEGRMDFRALLASRGWLHYAAFDLLWLNGKDLRGQPLIKRKRRLGQLIPVNNATLSRILAVEESMGNELYEAAQGLDLEGIVANRRLDPYSPQTVWYKVKNAYTQAEGRGDLFERRNR
jgi:bifunctional non-homologous end joining protein LigD